MIACQICTRHPHNPVDDHTDACHEVEADLGIICSKCAQSIRRNLDSLVDTWALIEEPGFPGGSTGEVRSKSSPLPGGTEWMDYRQGHILLGTLTAWARDWCETYALAGPKRGDLTSLARWLRAHLSSAANSHPAVDEFAHEVRQLAQRGRRLAGEVPDHGQRVPCPTDDCTRTLRVRTAELNELVRCKGCDVQRSTAQLLAIAARADAWVPADTAADVAGVTVSTLNRWAATGKVQREAGRFWLPSVREYKAARMSA